MLCIMCSKQDAIKYDKDYKNHADFLKRKKEHYQSLTVRISLGDKLSEKFLSNACLISTPINESSPKSPNCALWSIDAGSETPIIWATIFTASVCPSPPARLAVTVSARTKLETI
uniref:Uncharacterized protein n=1 Tax=Romanomermis culicivorax TaxID=13658 RepID=A0A915JP78_ROMCU